MGQLIPFQSDTYTLFRSLFSTACDTSALMLANVHDVICNRADILFFFFCFLFFSFCSFFFIYIKNLKLSAMTTTGCDVMPQYGVRRAYSIVNRISG